MKHVAVAPWRWWNWLYANYAREVTAGIALMVTLMAGGTYLNDRANARQDRLITEQTAQRTKDNGANAVTQCENANESRSASRTLWYFVVDLASQGADREQAAYLSRVRSWIGDVYRPHDCEDLGREYVIPPPPRLPDQ